MAGHAANVHERCGRRNRPNLGPTSAQPAMALRRSNPPQSGIGFASLAGRVCLMWCLTPCCTVAKVPQWAVISSVQACASAGAAGRQRYLHVSSGAFFGLPFAWARLSCLFIPTFAAFRGLPSLFRPVLLHCVPLRVCAWRWVGRERWCDMKTLTMLRQALHISLCKKDGHSHAGC